MKMLVKIVALVEKGNDVECNWITLKQMCFESKEPRKNLNDWAKQNNIRFEFKSGDAENEEIVLFSR